MTKRTGLSAFCEELSSGPDGCCNANGMHGRGRVETRARALCIPGCRRSRGASCLSNAATPCCQSSYRTHPPSICPVCRRTHAHPTRPDGRPEQLIAPMLLVCPTDARQGHGVKAFLITNIKGCTRFTEENSNEAAAPARRPVHGELRVQEGVDAARRLEVIELHKRRGARGLQVGSAGDRRGCRGLPGAVRRGAKSAPGASAGQVGMRSRRGWRRHRRGTAVAAVRSDLAARLCSLAAPGELFAGSTIAGVAGRDGGGIVYVDRGPGRAQGAGRARSRHRRSRRGWGRGRETTPAAAPRGARLHSAPTLPPCRRSTCSSEPEAVATMGAATSVVAADEADSCSSAARPASARRRSPGLRRRAPASARVLWRRLRFPASGPGPLGPCSTWPRETGGELERSSPEGATAA